MELAHGRNLEARQFDVGFDPLLTALQVREILDAIDPVDAAQRMAQLTASQVREILDAMDPVDAAQQTAQFQHLALHPYLAGVVAESRDPGLMARVSDAALAFLPPNQRDPLLRSMLTNDALRDVAAGGDLHQVSQVLDAVGALPADRTEAALPHLMTSRVMQVVATQGNPTDVARTCGTVVGMPRDLQPGLLAELLTPSTIGAQVDRGDPWEVSEVAAAAIRLPSDAQQQGGLNLKQARLTQLLCPRALQRFGAEASAADVGVAAQALGQVEDPRHRQRALSVLLSDGAVARVANEGKASDVVAVVNAARELPHPQQKQAALMRLLCDRARAEVAANGTDQERHAMASAFPQYQQLLDRHQAGARSSSPAPDRWPGLG